MQRSLVPESYQVKIEKVGRSRYVLNTSQVFPVPRERAFTFFKDPRNLCEITPAWLDFQMCGRDGCDVYEGAEFDYTIRWFGVKMLWRSRIVDYRPPEGFTDIQIKGPYKVWEHRHHLEEIPEGTVMTDQVTYVVPFFFMGALIHEIILGKQLMDIFCYRAVKIHEWVRSGSADYRGCDPEKRPFLLF